MAWATERLRVYRNFPYDRRHDPSGCYHPCHSIDSIEFLHHDQQLVCFPVIKL